MPVLSHVARVSRDFAEVKPLGAGLVPLQCVTVTSMGWCQEHCAMRAQS